LISDFTPSLPSCFLLLLSGPKCWYRVEWHPAGQGNYTRERGARNYRGWHCCHGRKHNQ